MAGFRGFTIDSVQLTNANVIYYTATNCRARIDKVTLTNVTGVNRLCGLYKVPVGGTAGTTNINTQNKTVIAGQSADVVELEGHWLNPGDFIAAVCDANTAVNLQISVVEFPQ